MKKRDGFTLIELLAVIVVLAVIALIAVPIVLNLVNTAKKGAAEASSIAFLKAVDNYMLLTQMNPDLVKLENGKTYQISRIKYEEVAFIDLFIDKVYAEENEAEIFLNEIIDMKGTKPTSGTVTIDGNKVSEAKIITNGYNVSCIGDTCEAKGKSNVKEEENEPEKILYKESILNGADPVLSGNLIAVNIDSNGKVTKANTEQQWYSYENKKWANAVILFGEDTYKEGDIIEEADIKQYYVWIPRYKYQLWNVNSANLYPTATKESAINIVFESKNTTVSNGDENGEWLTHPAFTSFDTAGIWVGKYETSYNEETYTDNTKFLTSNPNYTAATSGTNMIIKPNVRSLTNKTVSQFYTMSREVNRSLNSHLMKNSEWGAVAYLTYSNYGKCTNGVCNEVYVNNVNTGYLNKTAKFSGQWESGATITGCSGSSASAEVNSNKNSCETGYAWNGSNNKASTTGNTSGIYDMSGGNWEYMMAVVSDKNGNLVSGRNSKYNSGFNGIFGCPTCDSDTSGLTELTTGIAYPTDTRYYDLYEYEYDLNTDIWYDYTNGKLGDATKEIAATKSNSSSGNIGLWYTDYAGFPSMTYSWFLRGGNFYDGTAAGVLCFLRNRGNADGYFGSRVVLAF